MIAFFAAARRESRPLAVQLTEVQALPYPLFTGAVGGKPVCLCVTGIGKANAAAAAQYVLDRYAPEAALYVGTAGALTPDLAPAEVVAAGWLCHHDLMGLRHPSLPGRLPCGEALLAAAAALPCRIGPVATGDRVVCSAADRAAIHAATGALCVEMEGAALVQTAARMGVPALVLRGISDRADGELEQDFARHSSEAIRRVWDVALALLQRL